MEGLVLVNIDPNAKGWMDWAAHKVRWGRMRKLKDACLCYWYPLSNEERHPGNQSWVLWVPKHCSWYDRLKQWTQLIHSQTPYINWMSNYCWFWASRHGKTELMDWKEHVSYLQRKAFKVLSLCAHSFFGCSIFSFLLSPFLPLSSSSYPPTRTIASLVFVLWSFPNMPHS